MKSYEKAIKNKLLQLTKELNKLKNKQTDIELNKKANIRNIAAYLLFVSKGLITKNLISITEAKIQLLNEIIVESQIMELE